MGGRIDHTFGIVDGEVTVYEIPGAEWVRFDTGGYYDVYIGTKSSVKVDVRSAFTLPIPPDVPKRLFVVSIGVIPAGYAHEGEASFGTAVITYGACAEEPHDYLALGIHYPI